MKLAAVAPLSTTMQPQRLFCCSPLITTKHQVRAAMSSFKIYFWIHCLLKADRLGFFVYIGNSVYSCSFVVPYKSKSKVYTRLFLVILNYYYSISQMEFKFKMLWKSPFDKGITCFSSWNISSYDNLLYCISRNKGSYSWKGLFQSNKQKWYHNFLR